MKVYVSELPKSCEECSFAVCDGFATYCPFCKHKNGDHKNVKLIKDCPLQSLADYTKQVRKEVCERLDKIIEKYLCKKGRYRESLDISSIIKQVMKENLDQIQGE